MISFPQVKEGDAYRVVAIADGKSIDAWCRYSKENGHWFESETGRNIEIDTWTECSG